MLKISAAIAGLIAFPLATAGADAVPNMKGTWLGELTIVITDLTSNDKPAMREGKLELVIDTQNGAVFSGKDQAVHDPDDAHEFDAERWIGAVGPGANQITMVDHNGTRHCELHSATEMTCVYTHHDPKRAIIAYDRWKKTSE